jgi:sigma-B regulation protein RsbU (phosphoserine phosphatase)
MKMESTISGETSKTAAAVASKGQPAVETVKVLLVEDDPDDARLIQMMVSAAGGSFFSIEHVTRLQTGLQRLDQGGIGVVLADLSLPDSRGLETFSRLHARAPQTPIIVLSGLDDTTLAVRAVHEGAQDFLVKGQVDGQLLVRAMRYSIERKAMAEQLARYADELRSKNAQLEADFNMAREIQEIFLPHQHPTFPHSVAPEQSALRFSQRYLPAAAVGGDFFNIFPITDTTCGMFICDVMGHGMRAALVTAIMRGMVEELMPLAADPGKFLAEINRSLHAILRRTREPFLATACYVVLDVATGELRFANAGHPSPLRVARGSQEVQALKACDPRHGPALGLFEESVYPVGICPLAVNDLLILFTDGLYEAIGPDGQEYGMERLLKAIRERAQLPVEKLFDGLLEEIQSFSGVSEFEDDVCLVGAEVHRIGVQP